MQEKKGVTAKSVFWISIGAAALITFIVWVLGPRLLAFPHLPDQGSRWYYWKLPEPRFWSRFTSWLFYGLHQLSVWYIVIRAYREKAHPDKISRLNIAMLLVNLVFVLLHLLQTHIWYDGLAQDVPIWTSQFSVIIMLVLILFMLIPRRGIFWGKKIAIPQKYAGFIRGFHGYYISWALVYTFWFHPMEGNYGLLIGFAYMFLLFIQMSMFNTRYHVSVPWITLLEVFVGFHGPLIAIMKKQDSWPMFFFGFMIMFLGTQIHGLKLKRFVPYIVLAAWLGGAAAAYYYRGYGTIYEVLFIPAGLYGGVFFLLLIGLFFRNKKRIV
ncbi:MAG: hypothetical protein E4H36_12480 [Spirochaetales bacterium]|nr:MAG: hypothetical protein E4H36_12480 [Spirochaetales bacterium]